MDDNKVYAKNTNELELLLGEIKLFFSAVELEINTENSAVMNLRGDNTKNPSSQKGILATLEQLDSEKSWYKYLGKRENKKNKITNLEDAMKLCRKRI